MYCIEFRYDGNLIANGFQIYNIWTQIYEYEIHFVLERKNTSNYMNKTRIVRVRYFLGKPLF